MRLRLPNRGNAPETARELLAYIIAGNKSAVSVCCRTYNAPLTRLHVQSPHGLYRRGLFGRKMRANLKPNFDIGQRARRRAHQVKAGSNRKKAPASILMPGRFLNRDVRRDVRRSRLATMIVVTSIVVMRPFPATTRRRFHTGRRSIAGAPPARLTRTRRRRVPISPRMDFVAEPSLPVLVPRPADVIAVPIVGGREGDDRNAESGDADVREKCCFAVVVEPDVFAVDPAAIVAPTDIAPGFIP